MRAYYFNNMYLSSIQQGIQIAHVTADMMVKYEPTLGQRSKRYCMLLDWAANYKTMIVLNAGYSDEVLKLYDLFKQNENPYPWSMFNESKEALGGIPTSIGIILPQKVYDSAAFCRQYSFTSTTLPIYDVPPLELEIIKKLSEYEKTLVDTVNQYGLAR